MTLQTMQVQGGNYAKVPVRLKDFREKNPRASVETEPTIDNGQIVFKARIVVDKSDPNSAEATGHSFGENKGPKAFEKLETIAVGRALALLGWLNNGEVATTEEMEEFYAYKQDKVVEAIDKLNACKTIDELKTTFMSLGSLMSEPEVVKFKDQRKGELA